MSTFVLLMNLTKQGVTDVKNAPARIKAAEKALEAAGGKLLDFYVTMGPYDYVAIAETPNDNVALAQVIGLAMSGNVKTISLKAFSRIEFDAILKSLPSQ